MPVHSQRGVGQQRGELTKHRCLPSLEGDRLNRLGEAESNHLECGDRLEQEVGRGTRNPPRIAFGRVCKLSKQSFVMGVRKVEEAQLMGDCLAPEFIGSAKRGLGLVVEIRMKCVRVRRAESGAGRAHAMPGPYRIAIILAGRPSMGSRLALPTAASLLSKKLEFVRDSPFRHRYGGTSHRPTDDVEVVHEPACARQAETEPAP